MRERFLALLADLLDYPHDGLAEATRECESLARQLAPEAAPALGRFREFVEATPPGRLEEVYSATFDLDASCHPYVGHHLFGESYKRSVFMLELRRLHRARGTDCGNELPDHLPAVLRLLAREPDPDAAAELVQLALLPAVERMRGVPGKGETEEGGEEARKAGPYRELLEAVRVALVALGRDEEGSPCSTRCCS